MKLQKILLLPLLALLFACQNSEITVIQVPKESLPVKSPSSMADPHAPMADSNGHEASSGLHWETPAGWTEEAATSMRVGSFKAKGPSGRVADISVIPLSGVAGGLLANINRWRGQIQLDPLSESDLEKNISIINPKGKKMTYVEFVSNQPVVEGKFKAMVVAAIYEQGAQTWFFKMTGDEESVKSQKSAFQTFLENLHGHEAQ